MTETEFKHNALNKLVIIYGHAWHLEKASREHINEELAIEARDLCQDIIHKINMFEKNNSIKIIT